MDENFDGRIFGRIKEMTSDDCKKWLEFSLPPFGDIDIKDILYWIHDHEIGVLADHSDDVMKAVEKWAENNPDYEASGFGLTVTNEEFCRALTEGGARQVLEIFNDQLNAIATEACVWGAITALENMLEISGREIIVSGDETGDSDVEAMERK